MIFFWDFVVVFLAATTQEHIDSSGNQHGESNIILPIKMAFFKKHHTGLSLFTTRRLMLVLLCIIDFFLLYFYILFFSGCVYVLEVIICITLLYTQSSIFIKCFTRHNFSFIFIFFSVCLFDPFVTAVAMRLLFNGKKFLLAEEFIMKKNENFAQ